MSNIRLYYDKSFFGVERKLSLLHVQIDHHHLAILRNNVSWYSYNSRIFYYIMSRSLDHTIEFGNLRFTGSDFYGRSNRIEVDLRTFTEIDDNS